jgi:signal transduction histidine kinase
MTDTPPLVLVVDDNEGVRFTRIHQLQRAGYRVISAGTAAEGLRLATREHPDIAVLDVNLPDMHGFELCRRVKALEQPPAVQVLQVSSTSVDDHARATGLASGADAYLTEPVGTEVLLATIAALLRVRRAEQSTEAALTREREARAESERANQSKDDFLATLSHELRTPLSAMVGWIWYLRHGGSDPAARQRAIDGLERSTATQLRLINDLLDVSRISQGKLQLEHHAVDLSEVIDAAVDSVQVGIKAKRLNLSVRHAPATMAGDAARLQQVIVNLLTNAIQFSVENGHLEVSLTAAEGMAVIQVRDDGAGIAPDLLPHIFDRFRQGDTGMSRRHGGLGLGLAIVREIVALHGGKVTAHSEGPGRGATFTVELPLIKPRAAQPSNDASAALEHLAGKRFLVVEDDDDGRFVLKALLESAGAVVIPAASAEEGLEVLRTHNVDGVLTDLGMPGRDGFEFKTTMRALGYGQPTFAVTAFCTPEERERVLSSGFRGYFAKPYDPVQFLADLAAQFTG